MAGKRMLIVATSHAEMGQTGHRTGLWLEELAVPYYALKEAGIEVVLASMRGGEIPFDPRSVPVSGEAPPDDAGEFPPAVRRFLDDQEAMAAARDSLAVEQVDAASLDGIFLPGGHGVMWDMPEDRALADIVGGLFDAGKVVAAVCHGPAGLVGARRRDGRPVVEGRRVSGFANTEEEAVGLGGVVPFLLEDRLRELGGRYEKGPDWQPFALRDGNLVTGQNPMSSELTARYAIEALKEGARQA